MGKEMILSNDVKNTVMKQLFGVGFAASSELSILSEVLMYYRHPAASFVKVCYDLAPRAWRLSGSSRTGVAVTEIFGRKFSGLGLLSITAAIEEVPDLFG
jgi:hypothetical protein